MKKTFGQRQIPTLIGLVILVLSLIGGIALIGEGGGVFAPRAAPQTTPKNVKITNVKDTSATISFITDEATTGFVKYGTEPGSLKFQASDDRDQVTGSVAPYNTHYVTLRDLKADTTYYFTLGTGSNSKYDNNGSPYVVKTAKRLGTPPSSKTLYGTVQTSGGSPAAGMIVYLNINGAAPLSSLTKDSGSWAVPLSNARTLDGSQYATVNATDEVQIMVQGNDATAVTTMVVKVEEAQPVPPITLGASSRPTESTMSMVSQNSATETSQETPQSDNEEVATQNPTDTTGDTSTASPSATPDTQPATEETTVDLTANEPQTVNTTQPTITGEAAPATTLTIQINSETQINTTVTTDSQGKYTIDLEALKKELEPGEHTITISYTDPTTGKLVTETKTFTVTGNTAGAESSSTLLAAASPQPFGTGNPFTITSPSPTPTLTPSATATASPRVSVPATSSGSMKAGAVETTFALLLGGFFFVVAGIWTYLHNVKIYSSE